MADMSGFLAEHAATIKEHLRMYIETDGKEGYYRDMSFNPEGGDPMSTTLVLKTIGRKSGRVLLAPLLFMFYGEELVIVASKGGADENPGWFFNLTEMQTVDVQVKDKRYRCIWRIAEGAEREKIWPLLTAYYPPYRTYQSRTDRLIPAVVLTRGEELKEKFSLGEGSGIDARTEPQKI